MLLHCFSGGCAGNCVEDWTVTSLLCTDIPVIDPADLALATFAFYEVPRPAGCKCV